MVAGRQVSPAVNTHGSSSLSDSESVTSGRDDGDCWPAASTTLKGAVAGIMSLRCTARSGPPASG